jgi:hypothetical protein
LASKIIETKDRNNEKVIPKDNKKPDQNPMTNSTVTIKPPKPSDSKVGSKTPEKEVEIVKEK